MPAGAVEYRDLETLGGDRAGRAVIGSDRAQSTDGHADRAWACFLACHASGGRALMCSGFVPVPHRETEGHRGNSDDAFMRRAGRDRPDSGGWGGVI